jgi:hypothetical protein
MLLALAPIVQPARATEAATEWNFTVQLDGKDIGTHRFALEAKEAAARRLVSEARFSVKVLGITAYRYQHRAEETWSADCLATIDASTNDDGEISTVQGRNSEGGFAISAQTGRKSTTNSAAGCLMSFAYWNPAVATQTRLLDPGNGRIRNVAITALPASLLPVRGSTVSARGLRITGTPRPIDVWYVDNNWVGLDTTVKGGRKLSYRLN